MQNQKDKFSDYIADKYGISGNFNSVKAAISDIVSCRGDAVICPRQITSGKMLRPLILLLCGNLGSEPSQKHITAAAVVEIIHYASLIHDDIIDSADTRRHRENIRSEKGDKYAVMLGDWLISTSLGALLNSEASLASGEIMGAVKSMCEGELLQNKHLFSKGITEDIYLEITRLKTACFFGCCCSVGIKLSGGSENDTDICREFGRSFGMAFQIINDVTDFKTTGRDVKNGQKTLPAFRLEKYAAAELAESSSLQTAGEYIDTAIGCIEKFNSPASRGLVEICELLKAGKL